MCSIGAAALGMGAFQTIAGISQANDQAAYANAAAKARYNAQKAAAERNNIIAIQNYNSQLSIAKQKDQIKKDQHAAQIAAYEAAILASQRQTEGNTLEANRAVAAAALDNRASEAELAFERQKAVASMIHTQGKMLSTGASGQSFMMQTEEAMKVLGQEQARLDEVAFNQHQNFGLTLQGVALDYASAEWRNFNDVPGVPQAQRASLAPYEPIKDMGPAAPIRRTANYLPAIASGASTFLSAGAAMGGANSSISTWFN